MMCVDRGLRHLVNVVDSVAGTHTSAVTMTMFIFCTSSGRYSSQPADTIRRPDARGQRRDLAQIGRRVR
jgi:hypothetical protein